MQFMITNQIKNGRTVFYLSGDLNYEGTVKLKDAFNAALAGNETNFVLNMQGLKMISSYSLSTILKLSYLAKKHNGSVAIICPEGNVWDVFYILEFGKVLPLYPSEDKLWEALKNGGAGACLSE
jgi:anti-anti-sigma factor